MGLPNQPAGSGTWRGLSAYVCAGVLTIAACQGPPDLGPLRLDTGDQLSTLALQGDTTAVLVVDPSDCLACGLKVGAWQQWQLDGHARRVHVILTRPPTPGERRALRAARLHESGRLGRVNSQVATPRVYRYVGVTPADSAVGSAAVATMTLKLASPAGRAPISSSQSEIARNPQ